MEVVKFQGMMCPTTPFGSIRIYVCNSRAGFGTSPGIRVTRTGFCISLFSLSLSLSLSSQI